MSKKVEYEICVSGFNIRVNTVGKYENTDIYDTKEIVYYDVWANCDTNGKVHSLTSVDNFKFQIGSGFFKENIYYKDIKRINKICKEVSSKIKKIIINTEDNGVLITPKKVSKK